MFEVFGWLMRCCFELVTLVCWVGVAYLMAWLVVFDFTCWLFVVFGFAMLDTILFVWYCLHV